jgi:phage antirepressor YoqD-like protein
MQTSIINFDYKGSQISFNRGENVMVNATQMAKPFDKSPKDFLKTDQTKRFILALSEVKKILSSDLVRVVYGDNGGTWMHEDVALEFARWLSPAFAIWCNDRIKELLTTGVTTVSNDDEAIAYAIQVLNKRLEQAKMEKAMLEQQNNYLTNEIRQSAPKVAYVDNVLQSVNTYTSTQMAKELAMREAEQLHKALKEKGIMFKQSGQWMLTAKYSERGYTKPRTTTYTRSDGSQGTNTITVWTELGRAFLHKVFTK